MTRVDVLTPIHKGIRSMIYELGKELQTLDFTDERATENMITKLRQDLSAASSTCIVCLLHGHSTDEESYVFPDVRTYEPQIIDTLLAEHREVVRKIAEVGRSRMS
ncbi:MAG TPA: hemerythrin domain-containing protein [Candidatus Acidoferrales bacterium]|nr:hemerythrin domain-containing protein [Candidatus Acidoferrales bacterium]